MSPFPYHVDPLASAHHVFTAQIVENREFEGHLQDQVFLSRLFRGGLKVGAAMQARLGRHSKTSFDPESRAIMEGTDDRAERQRFLIHRWQDRLSAEEKAQCQEVLDRFQIDGYRMDRSTPTPALLNFPDFASLLNG